MNIRKYISNCVFVLVLFVSLINLYADNNSSSHTLRIIIPKIALLDIESTNTKNITLNLESPTEAGDPIVSAQDNSIWLNVTSVIEKGNTHSIAAKIDNVLEGIDINVASDLYSGAGYGYWGITKPSFTLNTLDQVLISGIKSGVSGNGANNGYNLKYVAKSNDLEYEKIVSSNGRSITVTYTLSQ